MIVQNQIKLKRKGLIFGINLMKLLFQEISHLTLEKQQQITGMMLL